MSSGVVQVAEEAGFLLATRRRRFALLLPKVLWRPSENSFIKRGLRIGPNTGEKITTQTQQRWKSRKAETN
jgi:hypothetical protein